MTETDGEELRGTVEDVVFSNAETGFTVIDMCVDDKLITAVGMLPNVSVGETIRVIGRWDRHPSFGRQLRIIKCEREMPKSVSDMLKYLSSGAIKGIGPKMAAKIIEAFGDAAFSVIENEPDRLAGIKGISENKAVEISREFKKQFAIREVMIYLEKFGMTSNECVKVFKAFGPRAVDVITENPYILCNDIIGISFKRADEIAGNMPSPSACEYRLGAGTVHVLRYNLRNGHTCLPKDKVISTAAELLDSDEETIFSTIDKLTDNGQLICKNINGRNFLFLPYMYTAEYSAAQRLSVMLKFPPPKGKASIKNRISSLEKKFGIHYEKLQAEAITTALEKGMLILTGGPGTGKTTTLNGIIELFERNGLKVALTAPTGRAAKRMSEITGREAKTIHRLLEVEWKDDDRPSFQRNLSNPLPYDAVIVDELSMVDISLFSSLLDALKLGCRLIMVGDSDQLPAVGAGNVLHDLIDSGLIPVVALKEIFRQAMESLIVTNAHKIVSGEMPELDRTDNDFFFMSRSNVYLAASTVIDLYTSRLPKAYGYDPIRDIQILCPSRKGETGSVSLNTAIQKCINPPDGVKNEFNMNGRVFREGDRVMQIKNNYDIPWKKGKESGAGIFNGDIGTLEQIKPEVRLMKIIFDDKEAIYSFDQANQLELAYAITVHKSQGSEYNAVVMPVCSVLPQLSYRNLLYTAVTRAKSKLILVGTKRDIYAMVENDKRIKRYSALKYFLTKNDE
ncbi:MAG: ATP-dependent RecD-like DNA helicase [Oscillospiraceae bacterium]|nr:ATP-dependent RecD-like DNA helicase [Oscillospiraceae bacterium]